MAFLRTKTNDGHQMDEIYSWLQKSIRRGLSEESLYACNEIYKTSKNACRKRLILICLEDLGHLILAKQIMECSDEDIPKYSVILSKTPKTRISALASRVLLEDIYKNYSEEEECLFYYLFNKQEYKCLKLANYLEFRHKNFTSVFDVLKSFYPFIIDLAKIAGGSRLLWITAIICFCRGWENREIGNYKECKIIKYMNVPDYALDKHTGRGKRMGRDMNYFLNDGIKLDDEFQVNGEDYKEAIKIYSETGKRSRDMVKEIKLPENQSIYDYYEKLLQAQLITGRNKPKVFFTLKDGIVKVIKGPLKQSEAENSVLSDCLKDFLGLQSCLSYIKWYKEGLFIIMDCYLDVDFDKFEIKSSKLEENSKIALITNKEVINQSLFEVLAYRYCTRSVDNCSRNLIYYKDVVVSIDENFKLDDVFPESMWKTKIKSEFYKKEFEKFKIDVRDKLKEWIEKIKFFKYMTEKQKEYFIRRAKFLISEEWPF